MTADSLDIKTLTIDGGRLVIQGTERSGMAPEDIGIYACDETGSEAKAETAPYRSGAVCFSLDIPVHDGQVISFRTDPGEAGGPSLSFDRSTGLRNRIKHDYTVISGHIVARKGRKLVILRDTPLNRAKAEAYVAYEMLRKDKAAWPGKRLRELRLRRMIGSAPLEDRVAFITPRSTDCLTGSMEKVYSALDLPKTYLAVPDMGYDSAGAEKALRLIASSRIVVTDDYLTPLRLYDKKPGQRIVQLWHATGAGKKFGRDGTNMFPEVDALTHKDYDAVTVSAEGIRGFYAHALSLPVSRIKATGVARTDDYFDPGYAEAARRMVFEKHPGLEGRRLIMYAPTFRDVPGEGRSSFRPDIDFGELSEALPEDCVFVICPHPVMTERILDGEYDNILELRDVSTKDMMFASDVLVTDYSSVFFEYSLLDRPMAFYCYDFDTYERDFYMDFENEIPGPLMKTREEFMDYIRRGEFVRTESYAGFRDKYLGACDGHSTERTVKMIKEMFDGTFSDQEAK